MRKKTQKAPEVCPKCGGSGYMVTEAGASPCPCRRTTGLDAACRVARIPPKFMPKTLAGFQARTPRHRDIVSGARSFLKTFRGSDSDHPGKGLLLVGKEGTGKTHIAVAILKEVIGKGYRGLYWNVPELFLELRRLMSNSEDLTEADIFDEAAAADLVVLDDLGAEKTSEYVMDRLYVLINGRYQDDTPTIITTNRTPEELRQQLGPRIASRICEMCVTLEFPDGDFRRLNLR